MKIQGFRSAAVHAGIRYKNRLDLGLIVSDRPAIAAGVFTRNTVKAAPILINIDRLKNGRMNALLVNSGIANASTGEIGMETAKRCGALVADALALPEDMVLLASTGVIGQQLNIEKFSKAMPNLVSSLSSDGFSDVAQAIMTTDTVPKTSSRRIAIGDTEVNLHGIAKGSGMIMPDMATMLCFVMTDVQIVFPLLQKMVRDGVDSTFNRISVDGDTSTNDMVIVMANGMAGNPWIDEDNHQGIETFSNALHEIFHDLALQIVADGEGATKLVTIRVIGARDDDQALAAVRTVANSPLVKTAFFGEDANWGRILAALGRSGCRFQPEQVDVLFDAVKLVENGQLLGEDAEKNATAVLRQPKFTLSIVLQEGIANAEFHTCDLSVDYVKINANYRS